MRSKSMKQHETPTIENDSCNHSLPDRLFIFSAIKNSLYQHLSNLVILNRQYIPLNVILSNGTN